ncbi:D-tyrosyl-tRNA(Tyr) deacylase [bacterium]|nr:D-tyrosyl-tRNA(Tyr) deacylase [bacterium]
MKLVIQRVKESSVTIDNKLYSKIGKGIMVLLGVEKGDTIEQAKWLSEKLLKLRIFEDEDNKMNLSIQDIKGEILVVSQFTLAGNCKKGTRPSFDNAELPDKANKLYEEFCELLSKSVPVKTGVFGAMMDVALINDGPVTFILEKSPVD